MPEGPECRRIAESLAKFASNKTVVEVEILSGRYLKKSPSGLEVFKNNGPLRAVGVGVHGKFIYWILEKEFSIWNTLGMTGYWSTEEHQHNRIKISFSNGDYLYFRDQRNFGTLKFVRGKHQLIEKLHSLGPDMLSQEVTDEEFISCLRKKNKHNVCKVLMDQSVICGIGNYVKADSLWLAKINPHSQISELTDAHLQKLKNSIQRVLKESYKTGGATIRTYQNLDGQKGEYASKFLVYNRKTDSEGHQVIRESTPDGRTTHWSPAYQTGEL
jgi:formamidopyrimidine-DNA glycosylase|tara:strand:- start:1 stop:816 length:816 start_codon:yes stop_codon:yes gene_type:complete